MFVDRSLYRLLITLCVLALPVRAVRWEIESVTSSGARILFHIDPRTDRNRSPDSTLLFAFTSLPGLAPQILVEGDLSGNDATAKEQLSFKSHVGMKGNAGNAFLQWVSFVPGGSATGHIFVDFGKPVIAVMGQKPPRMRNNTLELPLQALLAKRMNLSLPELPFVSGLRIEVDKDGIYELPISRLREAGVPVASIPSQSWRLISSRGEVPIYFANTPNTVLSDNDRILFYGRFLRGDHSTNTQYSDADVYWLTWNTGKAGVRMREASGARRFDPTLYRPGAVDVPSAAQDFPDTLHVEYDNGVSWLGEVAQPQDIDNVPEAGDTLDNWYWGSIGQSEKSEFSVPVPSPSVNVSDRARMRISMMGLTGTAGDPTSHDFTILLNGNSPSSAGAVQRAIWGGQQSYLYQSDFFSVSPNLKHGDNLITFLRQDPKRIDRAALNWVEIEYIRRFQALNDQIWFRNNPRDRNGLFQFSVKGFSHPSIDLWDLDGGRAFIDYDATFNSASRDAASYTLSFQDSIGTSVRYFAQTTALRRTPRAMTLDTVPPAWNFPKGLDYVIITHGDFFTSFQPLVDYYTRKGMIVGMFEIEDIYNRFCFGVRNPESIRSFMKYLMSQNMARFPRYLLLGGDTSHDLDKANRDQNIVPTHLSHIPGWGIAADDGYFATCVGDDNFADLNVGRFPVRTPEEARSMVDKTIRYLVNPARGYWHDNLFMIGGIEPEFTGFNNDAIRNVVWPAMNVLRMDADPASPWFREQSTAPRTIADYINAGAYAVNFTGHGGGNVWSDNGFFSYTDLGQLYNGQWSGGGRLPIIFSFTCLTGFFESIWYRSLGEEFVRLPLHGAIAFYGASGYTSKAGNLLMNRILLDKAVNGQYESLGELLGSVETEMLVRYGGQYLSLAREYNLLGDPALPWALAPDSLHIAASGQSLQAGDTLPVVGSCAPVSVGSVRVQVGVSGQIWHEKIVPVAADSFRSSVKIKDAAVTGNGLIRAFAWNDSTEVRGTSRFSKDSVFVERVTIAPPLPSAGDNVTISCRIQMPDHSPIVNVNCLYGFSTAGKSLSFNAIAMAADSAGSWRSQSPVSIESSGGIDEQLILKFRIIGSNSSFETDQYSFRIKGLPDLLFTQDSLRPYWDSDSIRVAYQVLNKGSAVAPLFLTSFYWGAGLSAVPMQIASSLVSVNPGVTILRTVSIPDTSGVLSLSARLNSGSAFAESRTDNNEIRGKLAVDFSDLGTVSDSLTTHQDGLSIRPASDFAGKHRVFIFSKPLVPSEFALGGFLPMRLSGDSLSAGFFIGARPLLANTDSLKWTFRTVDTALLPVVLQFDSRLKHWVWAGNSEKAGNSVTITTNSVGPLGLFRAVENRPPEIRASVFGRSLEVLDYAAKNRPISISITDPSGIIPSSVVVSLNGRILDSAALSLAAPVNDFTTLTLTAIPPPEHSVDSLTVVARDFVGNLAKKTFAYQPGEDLEIRFLTCNPNPFNARMMPGGEPAHLIRIAYLLTDVADNISLSIRTISGRPVMSWQLTDRIGYQEVAWNGKTQDGFRIANGTYYLKLVAQNRQKKVSKVIRIVKLEGF